PGWFSSSQLRTSSRKAASESVRLRSTGGAYLTGRLASQRDRPSRGDLELLELQLPRLRARVTTGRGVGDRRLDPDPARLVQRLPLPPRGPDRQPHGAGVGHGDGPSPLPPLAP